MKPSLISLAILLLLSACTPIEENSKEPEAIKNPISKDQVEIKTSPKKPIPENLDSLVENFLGQVREAPYQKMIHSPSLKKEVPYLEFFPKEGLSKTTLYTKAKAKHYQKISYTNLYLTSLEYETDAFAIAAFEKMKETIELLIAPAARGSFEDDKEYITMIDVSPYPGGFVVRKKNLIYSLRKTCGGNELKLSFKAYEDLFLKTLKIQDTETEIIRADCGDALFWVEKR